MDMTQVEGALVDLEAVAIDADDDDVREAAAEAMAALVAFIEAVSPGQEIAVEVVEGRSDSTHGRLNDMGRPAGPRPETKTPRVSEARRRPRPNMM